MTEVRAGLVTFLTMAYILFVNPSILSQGMPFDQSYEQLLTATALAAAFGSFAMGLLANYPFALAPGMGLNAYFTFGVVLGAGIPWQTALGATFVASVIFFAVSISGLRAVILKAIPAFIKEATAAGIGLFLAVIGLQNAGVMIANPSTLTTFSNLSHPPALLLILGIIIGATLLVRRVPGALLISLATVSAVAIFSGAEVFDKAAFKGFVNGVVAAPIWPSDLWLAMDIKGALKPEIFGVIAMFLFVDFFDTAGSLFGLASRAGMLDKNGDLPRAQRAFTADAAATIFSAMVGVSPTTTFVESAAGIEEGGRTGKTAIVAGLCFLIAPIFWPLATGIPPHAPAAVLVLVGSMMTAQLTKIDWNDFRISIPAFLTTISIPMSFSIANGISLGVITYVAISVLSGHAKKINWVMYALGALLLSRYFLLPNMR